MQDKFYIKKCIELAAKGKGYASPNPLVGCVIVKNDKILAQGYHHKYGDKHAEIDALDKLKQGKAKGSTLYVNLEPCSFKGKTPACTDRIIKEGISKVVIGALDPNPKVKGVEILREAGIEVIEGVLPKVCNRLNQFFFKWIQVGLPYVTIKIAQTSDHFIAYPDGTCPNITNKKSRTFVHKMRTWYDAVLVGKGTVESDNPALTIRHVAGRQPFRVVLDSQGELINSSKKILTDEYSKKTLWIVNKQAKFENPHNVQIIKSSNLNNLLKQLAKQNISSIFVEGGPKIWQSFLDQGLVDQIQTFTSPKKFKKGIPTLPHTNLDKIKYEKAETFSFGSDKLNIKLLKIY
jgi:diaminohydroxyphosphoribosylaminopyrimidine deaminase/5-amino-6-(5-phosphoribosylamino)uracil reductase